MQLEQEKVAAESAAVNKQKFFFQIPFQLICKGLFKQDLAAYFRAFHNFVS